MNAGSYYLYKRDQSYPDSCTLLDLSDSQLGFVAEISQECFDEIIQVAERGDGFYNLEFSVFFTQPIDSTFSILTGAAAPLDSSLDLYRRDRPEYQLDYGAIDTTIEGQYESQVANYSAMVHKSNAPANILLGIMIFDRGSNRFFTGYRSYGGFGKYTDQSAVDTAPPILETLVVSSYDNSELSERDYKFFTSTISHPNVSGSSISARFGVVSN